FNPSTTIRFGLSENGTVRLTVYNLLGQKVKTLVQQHVAAGYHTIVWNGRNESGHAVSSGVYLYRLEIQGHVVTKKMMFLK
ncbi:MAG TPA: FlgD immunoglobulin-like domain containing protein, partial [bacterium]|nr:FlgD immunoglobulin-like domain containing protein [bacterium]